MLLSDINKKNVEIKIIKIHIEDNLWKFGIFENSQITLVKKIYGNYIISYENHQYVIMKELANKIEVSYV